MLQTNYLSVPSDLNRDFAAEAAEYPFEEAFAVKNDKFMRTILGVKGVNIKAFQAIPGLKVAIHREKKTLVFRGNSKGAVEEAKEMLDTFALKAGHRGLEDILRQRTSSQNRA